MWSFILEKKPNTLYQCGYFGTSLVEVDPVFLKKKLFKNRKYFFSLSLLHVSPFGKGCGSSFELDIPLPMGILCRVWLELSDAYGIPAAGRMRPNRATPAETRVLVFAHALYGGPYQF